MRKHILERDPLDFGVILMSHFQLMLAGLSIMARILIATSTAFELAYLSFDLTLS